jgi:hypothetical protein
VSDGGTVSHQRRSMERCTPPDTTLRRRQVARCACSHLDTRGPWSVESASNGLLQVRMARLRDAVALPMWYTAAYKRLVRSCRYSLLTVLATGCEKTLRGPLSSRI